MHTEIAFSVPGMGVAPLLMTFPAPLLLVPQREADRKP